MKEKILNNIPYNIMRKIKNINPKTLNDYIRLADLERPYNLLLKKDKNDKNKTLSQT